MRNKKENTIIVSVTFNIRLDVGKQRTTSERNLCGLSWQTSFASASAQLAAGGGSAEIPIPRSRGLCSCPRPRRSNSTVLFSSLITESLSRSWAASCCSSLSRFSSWWRNRTSSSSLQDDAIVRYTPILLRTRLRKSVNEAASMPVRCVSKMSLPFIVWISWRKIVRY